MSNSPNKFTCLVVDDEPIARKILQNYVEQMPNLTCVGACKNAFEALEKINSEAQIDLLFLDINMPNLSGTALAKMLPQKPLVIFTTAYADFAVESYELNAVDYLLKPFLFERFAQSVFRAMERMRNFQPISPDLEAKNVEKTIFIKSDGENYPVALAEIVFCEAMKNYTKVVLASGKSYNPLISISKFEEDLAILSPNFLRVHRSFLISKKHLDSIGANYAMLGAHKIPIGAQYKTYFLTEMGV